VTYSIQKHVCLAQPYFTQESLANFGASFQENHFQVNEVTCVKGSGSRFLRDFGNHPPEYILSRPRNPTFNLLIFLKNI